MKKILFCTMVLFFAVASSAQTTEDMKASKERSAKLAKLKQPKDCGVAAIDKLTSSAGNVAEESVQITPILEGMYYRSIGQTEDGVTDVTVKKPTVEELTELSARIAKQAIAVVEVTKTIEPAGKEISSAKGPAALKATKSLNYSKDVLVILGEESVFQTKAIAAMIETAESAKNL